MEKNGQASIMASWRRLLLSAVACSALALGIGFISGTETRGLGSCCWLSLPAYSGFLLGECSSVPWGPRYLGLPVASASCGD